MKYGNNHLDSIIKEIDESNGVSKMKEKIIKWKDML